MKYQSRKYVDLIRSSSSKYANWNPPHQIKVGDFGTINRETGEFEKEGNIYEHPSTKDLAAAHQPEVSAKEESYVISSKGVKGGELGAGVLADVAGIAQASIKGRWEFGKKRGAILAMAQPQSEHVPPNVFLKKLTKVPVLQDKVLVTEATSCPAYTLYLSTGDEGYLSLALLAAPPVGPGLAAGGEVKMSWWNNYSGGVYRGASDTGGKNLYTPLCALKQIRKKGLLRRDSPVPDPEDDDLWVNAFEPWDPLNEDGEEELIEDTVFD